jgi:hypothetical protein
MMAGAEHRQRQGDPPRHTPESVIGGTRYRAADE